MTILDLLYLYLFFILLYLYVFESVYKEVDKCRLYKKISKRVYVYDSSLHKHKKTYIISDIKNPNDKVGIKFYNTFLF